MNPSENATASEGREGNRYIDRIPVRNIWLLLLYASELFRKFEKRRDKETAVEDSPDDIPNLVAEVLCYHVERRITRNLTYGYQFREAVLDRVRGRIDFLKTERRLLLELGKVACRFDELTVNTPRNCFVRAALEKISNIVSDRELARRSRLLALGLRRMGVIGERPGRSEVSIDRFGRHDAHDRPMVWAARLAFDLALPAEEQGRLLLCSLEKDIHWLRRLYEKAVAGFYDVVLSDKGWRVHAGKRFYWPIEDKSPGIDDILPSMQTDIILENPGKGRRIIIDTKFNSLLTGGWYREETVRSSYLYQIYAYLRSQESEDDQLAKNATGVLLHPSVGEGIYERVVIQNHEIRFATVDLGAEAPEIRRQLLQVINNPRSLSRQSSGP